jgi:hypothetical protein
MIAVDTNLLVHAHRRDSGFHEAAKRAIVELGETPTPWAIVFHCLVEFYGIATHAGIWKRPSSPTRAADQVRAWLESPSLVVLGDEPGGIDPLLELLKQSKIVGAKAHDARIASACIEHGVRELWTIDRDFSRFSGLSTRNPLAT